MEAAEGSIKSALRGLVGLGEMKHTNKAGLSGRINDHRGEMGIVKRWGIWE
jgi:hypothetical protein